MRHALLIAFVAVLITAAFTHYAHSNVIYKNGAVYWSGEIEKKNLDKFWFYTQTYGARHLVIESRGGDPEYGFILGAIIRDKNIKVTIERGTYCVSACAYAAAAAKDLELEGSMAFHRTYYQTGHGLTDKDLFRESIRLGMSTEFYFLKIGFPPTFTQAMLEHTSKDRYYIFKSVAQLNVARTNHRLNKSLVHVLTVRDYEQYAQRLERYKGRSADIGRYAIEQRKNTSTRSDIRRDTREYTPNPLVRIPLPTFRPGSVYKR
jgi:hypothetical protein